MWSYELHAAFLNFLVGLQASVRARFGDFSEPVCGSYVRHVSNFGCDFKEIL